MAESTKDKKATGVKQTKALMGSHRGFLWLMAGIPTSRCYGGN